MTGRDRREAIASVTGKPFADFYKEFAQAYWSRSFEPVKSWNWISPTAPVVMSQPVNTVFQSTVPALSSGLLTIRATTTNPPASFCLGHREHGPDREHLHRQEFLFL